MRAGDYERDAGSGLLLPRRRGILHARPQWMCGPAFFGGSAGGALSAYATTVLSDAPVLYYQFNETSGTTIIDSSGSGLNGTYGPLATLGASPLISTGKSMSIPATGTGLVASAPDNSALRLPSDFTLEFWLKTTTTASPTLMAKVTGGVTWGSWSIVLNDLGFVEADFRTSNASPIAASISSNIPVNTITFIARYIAITRAGTSLAMYIDGALNQTATFSGTPWSSTDPVGIGCLYRTTGSSNQMVGYIDEVAIYSTALSSTRIAAHYAARV